MRSKNLFPGLFLIVIGLFWILNNLNILNLQWTYLWEAMFELWPLILIGIGVNLIIKNKIIEGVTWSLFILILLAYSFFLGGNSPRNSPEGPGQKQLYSIELKEGMTKGMVDLDLEA